MNILIIEDDSVFGRSLLQGLTEAGHTCDYARDGRTGSDLALEKNPDLILLDLMLPEMKGMEVLQHLRSQGLDCPIVILTAKDAVDDRIAGLRAGADDYLVKPFAFLELLARIDAISRRFQKPAAVLAVDDITLDLTTRRVTRGQKDVDLTPTEFSLLEMLLRHAGQVVNRRMLCEHVWGFTWEGNTNVIEVHINRLRQKLDNNKADGSLIQTVRGRGYAVRKT